MEIDDNEALQERPARKGFLTSLFGRFRRKRPAEEADAALPDELVLAELEDAVEGLDETALAASLESGEASADESLNGRPGDDEEFADVAAEIVSPNGEEGLDSARAAIAGLIAARGQAAEPDIDATAASIMAVEPNGLEQDVPVAPAAEDSEAEAASEAPDETVVGEAVAVAEDVPSPDGEAEVSAEASDGQTEGEFVPVDEEPSEESHGEKSTLPATPPPATLSPAIMRADGSAMPRHRLGEYVFHKGLITSEALDAASREQEVTGDRIGQILVANGFLTDKDRVEAILATSSERIAQESVARSRIPSNLLDEYNIMISAETEDTVYVSTMFDEEVVRPIVYEYYSDKKIHFVSFLPTAMNGFIAAMKKSSAIDDASQTKETMLDRLLYKALNEGASDIHIIPRRKSYTAMLRMLGVRRIIHEGAMDEYKTMIAQIKDKARMDLAERRKPQDGGFQIEYSGKMIDLRVATLPTNDGEVCIMRVLDPDRVQPSLGQLGITDVAKWRKGFNQQHGLCLICGPTGSGKTTTLNSSIKEMDRFGKSIYTIEDPVEYRIPFTGQVSVNTTVGLNFATAVRAFMRADPDVIVLGEVRDEETARNAIKAADTGHLVLATLHTGSILGSVSRLKDLGVAPRELRYLLRSVLVQSLVRTICTACGGSGHHPDDHERSCDRCKGTRYAGRTVVSECEYFENAEQVDRILDLQGDLDDARTWPTMVEDAVKKYREGVTDLDELYRVFGAAIDPVLREQGETVG